MFKHQLFTLLRQSTQKIAFQYTIISKITISTEDRHGRVWLHFRTMKSQFRSQITTVQLKNGKKWCSRHLRPRLSQRMPRAPTKYNRCDGDFTRKARNPGARVRSKSKQSLHNPVWEKRKTRDRSMAAENRKCDLINWFGCPSSNYPLAMKVGKYAELLVFLYKDADSLNCDFIYVHVCTTRPSTLT